MVNLSVNANFGLTQGVLPAGMPRQRRLKAATLRGGALAIGFWGHAAGGQLYAAPEVVAAEFHADAFIAIGADGRVALAPGQLDMEVGAYMALAMLVADALAVDMAAIAPRPASPYVLLAGGACPRQCARAPDCMAALWEPLRRAAAAARTLLVQAAAARWGVTPQSCRAEQGAVWHRTSGGARAMANWWPPPRCCRCHGSRSRTRVPMQVACWFMRHWIWRTRSHEVVFFAPGAKQLWA